MKPNKFRPRYKSVPFGTLLVGYWFKASKTNSTWWVKKDDVTATSVNRQLESRWKFDDHVWIDISQSLMREHELRTRYT